MTDFTIKKLKIKTDYTWTEQGQKMYLYLNVYSNVPISDALFRHHLAEVLRDLAERTLKREWPTI